MLSSFRPQKVSMNIKPALFEDYDIRRVYDEKSETWYFSVVDIIRAYCSSLIFRQRVSTGIS
jgi:hypothetical protein